MAKEPTLEEMISPEEAQQAIIGLLQLAHRAPGQPLALRRSVDATAIPLHEIAVGLFDATDPMLTLRVGPTVLSFQFPATVLRLLISQLAELERALAAQSPRRQ